MTDAHDELDEIRLGLLRARYPAAFPPESDVIARRAIRESAHHEAAIRRVPLENGDAPAGIFSPVRPDRSGASE